MVTPRSAGFTQKLVCIAACVVAIFARPVCAQTPPTYVPTSIVEVGAPVSEPYPNAATFDSKGRLIVVNPGQHQVEVYQGLTLIAHYGPGDYKQCDLYGYRAPIAADFQNPSDFVSTVDDIIPDATPQPAAGPCLSYPQGVAVDANDQIFVTDSSNYRIVVLKSADHVSADGSLQSAYAFGTFGGWVVDPGPVDANNQPSTLNGQVVDTLFVQPYGPPLVNQLGYPIDVGTFRDPTTGQVEVYVLDQSNNRVVGYRFSGSAPSCAAAADVPAGCYTQFVAFGTRGDADANPQGLVFPTGFGIDKSTGDLALADSGKHRIVVYRYPFTSATQWTSEIKFFSPATSGQAVIGSIPGFIQQGDVAFDSAHRLFILDSPRSTIHVFAPSPGGGYAFQFDIEKIPGDSADQGFRPGLLRDALGIDLVPPSDGVDPAIDMMVIADSYTRRVQVFRRAALSVEGLSGYPAVGKVGTSVTASVRVRNVGAADVLGVTPAFGGFGGIIAPGGVTWTPAGGSPGGSADIAAGGERIFSFTFTPQSTGVLGLQIGASGHTHIVGGGGLATDDPVVASAAAAPPLSVDCGTESLIIKSATIDSTTLKSGTSTALHVTLRNCSLAAMTVQPDVAVSPAGAGNLDAPPAPKTLGPVGQSGDTQTWDLSWTALAGTSGGVALTVSAVAPDGTRPPAPVVFNLTVSNDTVAPVTTIAITPGPTTGQFYRGIVSSTLTASDAGTGVTAVHCFYTIGANLAPPIPCFAGGITLAASGNQFTTPSFVLPDGDITIAYWSVDAAAPAPNVETRNTFNLTVDNTPPAISWQNPVPAANAAGWNNTPITLRFDVIDSVTPPGRVVSSTLPLDTPTSFVFDDLDAILTPSITGADGAGNTTTSSRQVKIDRLPPLVQPLRSPAPNANGWNNSLPVVVSWSIVDPGPPSCPRGICQASGLKTVGTITCATAACDVPQVDPGVCSVAGACAGAPATTINVQGSTHVLAKACDVAGNCTTVDAETKVMPIQVDVTPPEAYNVFDVATKNNLVYARDDFSGVQSTPIAPALTPGRWSSDDDGDDDGHDNDNGPAETRIYTIPDAAGNTEILTEKVNADGKNVHVGVLAFAYTNGCPTPASLPGVGTCRLTLGTVPPGTTKKFEWSVNKDGSLKELEQNMTIGRGKTRTHVKAKYDSKTNQTTIQSDQKNPSKGTLNGLVLLRMATRSRALVIEYTNPSTNQIVVFTP